MLLLTGVAGTFKLVRDISKPTYNQHIVDFCVGSGSTLSLNAGCVGYVTVSGNLAISGSLLALNKYKFPQGASGSFLHAEQSLTSSGILVINGATRLKGAVILAGTTSGSYIHTQNLLSSSGGLVVLGSTTLESAVTIKGATTMSNSVALGVGSGSLSDISFPGYGLTSSGAQLCLKNNGGTLKLGIQKVSATGTLLGHCH